MHLQSSKLRTRTFVALSATILILFLLSHLQSSQDPLGNTLPIRTATNPPQSLSRIHALLHDQHSLPHSILQAIPEQEAYNVFDILQHLDTFEDYPRDKRLIILHVIGDTISDRLGAISTALSYAINAHRGLLVLWDVAGNGANWGYHPLLMKEKAKFVLVPVNGFRVEYGDQDWAELNTNYYSQRDEGLLDHVVALSSRHVFLRVTTSLKVKYGPISRGVWELFHSVEPDNAILLEWTNFMRSWVHPEYSSEEVETELHRTYNIPYVFLENMGDRQRRLLLHELETSYSKRVIFVHAQYGLGNRLRALGSAMALANVTQHILVLIWVPDAHLNCTFNDLFANDMIVLDKLSMEWPPSIMHRNDPAMRQMDFYNFMRDKDGIHVHDPNIQRIDPKPNKHVYVKSAYVIRSSFTPRIISTTSAYWSVMRENLIPIPWIMELVHDPGLKSIREMIGVHIRSRTIENDIKGVKAENYGRSYEITDKWRKVTGLQTFVKRMRKVDSKQVYFIAADQQETIEALQNEFGAHRIRALRRSEPCEMRNALCVRLALADIICLSRTRLILGSHWSSFTETAVRLSGGKKALLAGVHFGKVSN